MNLAFETALKNDVNQIINALNIAIIEPKTTKENSKKIKLNGCLYKNK